jgi:hypothetical protein
MLDRPDTLDLLLSFCSFLFFHAITEILNVAISTFLTDYGGLDMYREWKKIEFPKEYYI